MTDPQFQEIQQRLNALTNLVTSLVAVNPFLSGATTVSQLVNNEITVSTHLELPIGTLFTKVLEKEKVSLKPGFVRDLSVAVATDHDLLYIKLTDTICLVWNKRWLTQIAYKDLDSTTFSFIRPDNICLVRSSENNEIPRVPEEVYQNLFKALMVFFKETGRNYTEAIPSYEIS